MKPQADIEKEFKQLFSALDTEEPSMRFTKNVMDSIEGLPVAQVSKRYVNPWVVKGIAAMLIVTIISLCIYTYNSAGNFSLPGSDVLGKLADSHTFYIILINVLLLLLFIEKLINRKRRINYLPE